MARRRKLKLPEPSQADSSMPLGRIAAGLVVLVALAALVLQVGGHVLGEDPAPVTPPAPTKPMAVEEPEDVAPDAPSLKLHALENVEILVEIDGEVVFDGTLPGGTDRRWSAGRVTAVELQDLTRAKVFYDGERVDPLGGLTSSRRLEFIDDL